MTVESVALGKDAYSMLAILDVFWLQHHGNLTFALEALGQSLERKDDKAVAARDRHLLHLSASESEG